MHNSHLAGSAEIPTALITGGSGALGSAICERLAQDGYRLFITYRSSKAAAQALCEKLAGTTEVHLGQMDLCDEASIHRCIEAAPGKFSRFSTLIYASGVDIDQPFISDTKAEQWDQVLKVETLGFIHLVSAALPVLRASGKGSIVSIGTFATHLYMSGDALSAVPKAAVEMMTRAVAKEEGRYGIRANCVAPGIINAGLGSKMQTEIYDPAIWNAQRKRVPLRRFGEASEVAEAVAFLASDRASYITGQTLILDGGMHV
ncbi:MAG: SDR family oxidoreductase [Rhodobacteraceae bacterium]|nr:SDR family oxidoreductase [Paracoccaceae bacterium]